MELTLERRDSSSATCPYCREVVLAADRVACACGVEYHPACRAELQGCATVGCQDAPAATAGRATCCRCGEAVRTRPVTCEACGERHHAWCRTRRCEASRGPTVGSADPTRATRPARSRPSKRVALREGGSEPAALGGAVARTGWTGSGLKLLVTGGLLAFMVVGGVGWALWDAYTRGVVREMLALLGGLLLALFTLIGLASGSLAEERRRRRR